MDANYLPVIKIGNVGKDGKIDISDTQHHKYSTELQKFVIKKADILVAMTGATVGKTAVSEYDNLLLNQRVGMIRSKGTVMQDYLKYVLLSQDFYDFCQTTAGGGAQGNISPSQILSYKIKIPSLEVQDRLVKEAEKEDAIITSNRQLVELMENKISGVLNDV